MSRSSPHGKHRAGARVAVPEEPQEPENGDALVQTVKVRQVPGRQPAVGRGLLAQAVFLNDDPVEVVPFGMGRCAGQERRQIGEPHRPRAMGTAIASLEPQINLEVAQELWAIWQTTIGLTLHVFDRPG